MYERRAVRTRVSLAVLLCFFANLPLVAAPLTEPSPGVWQEVARFAGTAVRGAQVFTIGDAGYVCLGAVNVTPDRVSEFWQYDPAADAWARKADFPGAARSGCVAVTVGRKAYVFGGYSDHLSAEIWEYDQDVDAWTKKSDCPGVGRFLPFAFAANGRPHFGAGSGSDGMLQDVWEYDPQADEWSRRADFPGEARAYAVGLSLGGKGYVAFGLLRYTDPLPLVKDAWEYDATVDAWTRIAYYAGTARIMTTGFVLGSDLYYGLGNDSRMRNVGDVWRIRFAQATL